MGFSLIGKDTSEVRIEWVIKQLMRLPSGASILDAGAGEGRFKEYCSHLKYTSQDFGGYDGSGDGSGLQAGNWDNSSFDIVSDITTIPVEDSSFDYVLCTEVLEHVPDAIAAVRELSRVLKPGGILIATAPFCSLTHFAPYHFSGYNHYWWKHHLPRSGLEIESIEPNGSWFSFVAQELRRSRMIGASQGLRWYGLVTRILVIPVLFMLSLMERYDKGTHETLCFGYMILGRKKGI